MRRPIRLSLLYPNSTFSFASFISLFSPLPLFPDTLPPSLHHSLIHLRTRLKPVGLPRTGPLIAASAMLLLLRLGRGRGRKGGAAGAMIASLWVGGGRVEGWEGGRARRRKGRGRHNTWSVNEHALTKQ